MKIDFFEPSDWSKVLSAMTRWAYSNAGRYDKEPVKFTLYTQFSVKSTYQDLYVYNGNQVIAIVYRRAGANPVLRTTKATGNFEESLRKWETKFNS